MESNTKHTTNFSQTHTPKNKPLLLVGVKELLSGEGGT